MLSRLRRSLARSTDELHAEALQARFAAAGTAPIAEAPDRGAVRIRGEVAGLQVVPRAGAPALEVTLDDGTGRAVVVFTGRTRVGGLDPGRAVEAIGMARRAGGRLVLLNPEYRLLRSGSP
ncbi:MAG TPA: OB-fold nucleic acid binding domain-containing protein [Iamia sp.]|nr:OB-fold nucleic acid binding domain-containing protein [Iamia sp.]